MAYAGPDLSGNRIPVVDDVLKNLDVLDQVLDGAGYEMESACSGKQVLDFVAGSSPDLILMDMMIPGINGFETCRRLKGEQSTRDIPGIFPTALDEVSSIVGSIRGRCADYIGKPV